MIKESLSTKTLLSAGRKASLQASVLEAYPMAMTLKKKGLKSKAREMVESAARKSQSYLNMAKKYNASHGNIRSATKDYLSSRRREISKPGKSKDLANRIIKRLNMNKKAYLEETYNSAFEDELEKISERRRAAEGAVTGAALGAGAGFSGLAKLHRGYSSPQKVKGVVKDSSGKTIKGGVKGVKMVRKRLSKTKAGLLLGAGGTTAGALIGALVKKKDKK